MGRPKDPALEQRWAERLRRHAASGLTVAAFCARQGLSVATFRYWRRRLAADSPPRLRRSGLFVPVRVPDSARADGPPRVDVVLPRGVCVRLPGTPEPEWLGRLVSALADGAAVEGAP
jgi:hypothetical protein